MPINWTTQRERASNQILKLPKARLVKIRRKAGARGFYHANRVVAEGEVIDVPSDIARDLVALGKAEHV